MPPVIIASGTSQVTAGYCPRLFTMTKLMPLPYSCETAEATIAKTPTTLARRYTDGMTSSGMTSFRVAMSHLPVR